MNLKRLLTTTSLIALIFVISPLSARTDSAPATSAPAKNSSLKTGMDVKSAQKIEVNGVKIENFTGRVIIKSVGADKTVRVSLKGSDDLLGQVLVTCDHEGEKGNLYIAFEKDAPVLNDMDKLILTLEMPAKMPLDMTLVGGKGDIEPRETNDTKINMNGFGDIRLKSVKSLNSKIDGSGEITVLEIDGDATLAIRGDGKYTLQKGTVPHLNASIGGTGVISVMANVEDAELTSEGAGAMELATVTGKLNQSMSGAGSIHIKKVDGSLSHKTSGSAQLKLNCGKSKEKEATPATTAAPAA